MDVGICGPLACYIGFPVGQVTSPGLGNFHTSRRLERGIEMLSVGDLMGSPPIVGSRRIV